MASKHCDAPISSSGGTNPKASIRSALPLRLEMDRLPCLTTGMPHAAVNRAAPVERFKLPEASPPVPTISIASRPSGRFGLRERPRMACAKPRTSAAVSPLARNAASNAPDIAAGNSGDAICTSKRSASASVRSRRCNKCSSSCGEDCMRQRSRKFLINAGPSGVRTLSGWNCTPSMGSVLCRTPMISPLEVLAVTSSTAGRLSGSAISE